MNCMIVSTGGSAIAGITIPEAGRSSSSCESCELQNRLCAGVRVSEGDNQTRFTSYRPPLPPSASSLVAISAHGKSLMNSSLMPPRGLRKSVSHRDKLIAESIEGAPRGHDGWLAGSPDSECDFLFVLDKR